MKGFISTLPWYFNNQLQQKITQSLILQKVPTENLIPGFSYAWKCLINGLHSKDYDFLEQFLEPKLFDNTKKGLKDISNQELLLEKVGDEDKNLSCKLVDWKCISGANVNRFENNLKVNLLKLSEEGIQEAIVKEIEHAYKPAW